MIAVIDSGGANIASVMFALERLGAKGVLTSDPAQIISAERVILPGVGAAAAAMEKLRALDLIVCIRGLRQPVFGICLGMQLLFSHSEEGDADMLDVISGRVIRFNEAKSGIVPHMGWNTVRAVKDHPLLDGLSDESYFYFVHSYFAAPGDAAIGICEYGDAFSAVAVRDNFMGCQFHPERSGKAGAQILRNFLEIPA